MNPALPPQRRATDPARSRLKAWPLPARAAHPGQGASEPSVQAAPRQPGRGFAVFRARRASGHAPHALTRRVFLGLALALLASAVPSANGGKTLAKDAPAATELHDGDLIFQRSQSPQCAAITAATGSPYTHVALVFIDDGRPVVYEAVQPVKRTPLAEWIRRGEGGHFVVKRLKGTSAVDADALRREVEPMLGRDYDWLFEWCDERLYCSELVWKAYQRGAGIVLAELRTMAEFDLEHEVVRPIVRQRWGDQPPLGMQVIAPSDLFESPLLETVLQEGELNSPGENPDPDR